MTLTLASLQHIIDDLGYPECGYPVSRSNSYAFALSNDIHDTEFGMVRAWLYRDNTTVKCIDIGTCRMTDTESVITHIDSRDTDSIADIDEVKRFIRIVDIA